MLEMKAAGKTNRATAEKMGLKDKYVVKEWVKRYNRRKRKMDAGIMPRRRGRPPKGYVPTEQQKDNEIRRLKMENELPRDFLRFAGRR